MPGGMPVWFPTWGQAPMDPQKREAREAFLPRRTRIRLWLWRTAGAIDLWVHKWEIWRLFQ